MARIDRMNRIKRAIGRDEDLCGADARKCLKQDGQDYQDEQDKESHRMLMSEAGWTG